MNEPWAIINGEWIRASQATVSVADAGFVLGATASEQVRTFRGRLFRWEEHLDRLERSLKVLGLDLPMSRKDFTLAADELVERNAKLLDHDDDLGLSIFVTPGLYATFAPGVEPRPTLGMHTYPLPFSNWATQYDQGAHLATVDIQPVPGECWPVAMKCRSRMHYYLADRQARAKFPGARALLIDNLGRVHDTSTATLIAVMPGGELALPPEDRILPGISAGVVHEIAARLGHQWLRCDLTLEDLKQARELLLASTPFCLLPATRLDGQPIGDGQPGPTYRTILESWNQLVQVDIVEQARRFEQRSKS